MSGGTNYSPYTGTCNFFLIIFFNFQPPPKDHAQVDRHHCFFPGLSFHVLFFFRTAELVFEVSIGPFCIVFIGAGFFALQSPESFHNTLAISMVCLTFSVNMAYIRCPEISLYVICI